MRNINLHKTHFIATQNFAPKMFILMGVKQTKFNSDIFVRLIKNKTSHFGMLTRKLIINNESRVRSQYPTSKNGVAIQINFKIMRLTM